MKKMDELRTKATGLYLEEPSFELTPKVIKVLGEIAKFYERRQNTHDFSRGMNAGCWVEGVEKK